MKRFSWEIILAGLFFVALALYLLDKPSPEYDNPDSTAAAEATVEPTPPSPPEQVHVIDLENLEELTSLEELQNLENLNELNRIENLEKLKELAHLIPSETRDEFLTEIDNVLRELSNDGVRLNFDLDNKLIVVNREYDNIEQGKWGNTSPGVYTFLNEFDASQITSSSVNIPNGSISVIGTNESKAKFMVQASGQISSVDDLNSMISISSRIENKEANFLLKDIEGQEGAQNIQLQATLYIPESIELVTYTGGGHIDATNISGDQLYETGGGHIELNHVEGEVVAVSGGGHMKVEDITGNVTLKTEGGHLVVKNCSGNAILNTKGGNIDAKDVRGEIIASTLGGNIMLIYNTPIDNDATLETSAGNIQIWLPKSSRANIELQASTGVELNGFTIDGTQTKTKVVGKINQGGPKIIGFSKYGKVTLNGNDN